MSASRRKARKEMKAVEKYLRIHGTWFGVTKRQCKRGMMKLARKLYPLLRKTDEELAS